MLHIQGHQAQGVYVPSIQDTSDCSRLRTHLISGNVALLPLTAQRPPFGGFFTAACPFAAACGDGLAAGCFAELPGGLRLPHACGWRAFSRGGCNLWLPREAIGVAPSCGRFAAQRRVRPRVGMAWRRVASLSFPAVCGCLMPVVGGLFRAVDATCGCPARRLAWLRVAAGLPRDAGCGRWHQAVGLPRNAGRGWVVLGGGLLGGVLCVPREQMIDSWCLLC